MTQRVDAKLLKEVEKFGKGKWNDCFHCGNCTAVCNLTEQGILFPRKSIRQLQLGLKNDLKGSVEPWLCYYCGDCSDTCPRQAEPAELTMTLRRWLMSTYDWTGFCSKFFKSKIFEIKALIIFSLVMLSLILLFFYPKHLLEFGHLFTLSAVSIVILFAFIPNVLRMWWVTIGRNNSKIPFWIYISQLKTLIIPTITHAQFRNCKEKSLFWLKHFFISGGYVLTLTSAIVGWVPYTYMYPPYHPINLCGIIGSISLLVSLGILIVDRVKKTYPVQKFSQLSDWLFMTWLWTFVFFLFLSYIFLSLGIEEIGYIMFIIFLVLACPWALILVPFSKTPHLLYRPLGIYFAKLKEKSIKNK